MKDTLTEEEVELGLRTVIKDGLTSQTMVTFMGGELTHMYIILGSGTAAHYAGSQLKEAGYQVTLLGINRERTEALREMGFQNVSRVNRIRLG